MWYSGEIGSIRLTYILALELIELTDGLADLTRQEIKGRHRGFGLENIFTGIGRKRVWGVGFGESWEKFRSPALETTDLKIL